MFFIIMVFGALIVTMKTVFSMINTHLSILIMYIGHLGPFTIATLWHFSKGERVSYTKGNISVG